MPNEKKTISVDPDFWHEWTKFVLNKRKVNGKVSEELEKALKEYMKRHEDKYDG